MNKTMEKHGIQFLLFENVPNRNKLLIVRCYIFFVNVNGGFVVEIIETKMTECVPSNDSVYIEV